MLRTIFRLLAATFVSVLLVSAQEADYALKIDVPLVTVDVTVEDGAGNPVNNLPRDAFEVYEDGVRQEIRYFAPVSAGYNVLLLFDRSGSTEDKWPLMQRATAALIQSLRPQDKIAIATFDYELQMQQQWTDDRQKALLTLPKLLQPNHIGGTNFYGSVEEALRRRFTKTAGRRVLIVLTDGRDTSFYKDIVNQNRLLYPEAEKPFRSMLKSARSAHIPVYFVAFNTDRNLQPNTIGADEYKSLRIIFPNSDVPERYLAAVRLRMEKVADASGGRILYPDKLDDIVSLYQQIGTELGTSYGLGYVSSNTVKHGTFRRIEVRMKETGYHLKQSRNGYDAK